MHTLEPLIPPLRRYARALLRNPWDADDLVQDTLERALSRWPQRRKQDNTRAWLFAILHNLAMTHLRRAARQNARVDMAAADMPDPGTTPEEHMHCQNMLAALAHLSEEQRSVLLLVAVEDLPYAEVARVLDIPVGTVMSRLSRARDRLHQVLCGETGKTGKTAGQNAAPIARARLRIVKNGMGAMK